MKKLVRYPLFIITISLGFGLVLAWIIAVSVQYTSDDEFCSKCHSMKPITESYLADVHGGNNQTGFKAKCTDCHLPHSGPVNHLYKKAIMSINDVFVETFYDVDEIDWEEKRVHRAKYTYDSGCIKCHQNFDVIHQRDAHAKEAHDYYEANKHKKCVLCHKNVGHKDLSRYLNQ
jgi:cytochrome c-type protein NapC